MRAASAGKVVVACLLAFGAISAPASSVSRPSTTALRCCQPVVGVAPGTEAVIRYRPGGTSNRHDPSCPATAT